MAGGKPRNALMRKYRAVRVGGALFLAMCGLCLCGGLVAHGASRDNGDAASSAGAGFRRLSVANFGGGDASRQLETKGSKDLPKEGPSQTTNQTHSALEKAAKKKTTCLTDGTATVAYCVAIIFFAFLGLAIVCDEYFQPSLEEISDVLKLSPDVAGATFLAAGSSAPELFTSIGDVFGPANSMGLGTIVGSAMFNILVIVALSASVASGELKIDHRPVLRDVCFYSASIGCLALFFGDGKISTAEGALMVVGYMLYIVWMVFNQRMFAVCCSGTGECERWWVRGGKVVPTAEDLDAARATADKLAANIVVPFEPGSRDSGNSLSPSSRTRSSSFAQPPTRSEMRKSILEAAEEKRKSVESVTTLGQVAEGEVEGGANEGEGGSVREAAAAATTAADKALTNHAAIAAEASTLQAIKAAAAEGDKGADEDDDEDRLAYPSDGSAADKVLFVFSLPLLVVFKYTIPDSAIEKHKKWCVDHALVHR